MAHRCNRIPLLYWDCQTKNVSRRNFEYIWQTSCLICHSWSLLGKLHPVLLSRRVVSYVIRDRNNNALVYDTVDEAIWLNPKVHSLLHSDRGFQYTNREFHSKLVAAGMTQSISRVAKCIDNYPMEGFWEIIKRERRGLGVLTPMEKQESYMQAA